MRLRFTGEIWHWRGPAPYHFVSLPRDEAVAVAAIAPAVSYGWGVIPVHGRIGGTEFSTSLFPRDGGYALPLRVAVRRAEGLELGDDVTVELMIDVP